MIVEGDVQPSWDDEWVIRRNDRQMIDEEYAGAYQTQQYDYRNTQFVNVVHTIHYFHPPQ